MSAARRLLPLFDRVLVERLSAPKQTKAGILLPESTEKANEAIIIAVGPGNLNKNGQHMPMSVKPGDKVLLPEFGGQKIKQDDKEYQMFRDSEILAIIESK